MPGYRPLLLLSIIIAQIFRPIALQASNKSIPFSGLAAYRACGHAVSFGERQSGSAANQKLQKWIVSQVQPLGGELKLDEFSANTPAGPVRMTNIILKFPGRSGQSVAITGHFDTKKIPMMRFVGANDGGSSTGFLIEFARVAANMQHRDDVYIVFFDGEEAVGQWTDFDSTYGSRHLAEQWGRDGTLAHLRALVNVDMIGDKELDIMNDGNSNLELRQSLLSSAAKLGDGKFFHQDAQGIEDDHIPFAQSGVKVLDVIDFSYGPNNGYWHSAADTMDKLSPRSFQVIGDVVVGLVNSLEQ